MNASLEPPLWTGLELVVGLEARAHNGLPDTVAGLSIDTRTLGRGELFFAIAGQHRDGHAFVEAALAKGAAAAVVDEAHAAELDHLGPLFIVKDVLAALGSAARAARRRSDARIVAVTGSVGKTGTKEALRLALSGQAGQARQAGLGGQGGAGGQGGPSQPIGPLLLGGHAAQRSAAPLVHASAASYNNQWGVPLSLARMPAGAAFGVFEIGMSAAREIATLVDLVRPHVAIVTTIAPVHLEFFPSVAAIADAKAEIFYGLEPGGTAIVNRDDAHYERLKAHALASPAGRIVSFGEHAEADVRLVRTVAKPELSLVEAEVFGTPVTYRLGSPGRHVVINSLGVLAAVHALGADLALAALLLGDVAPPAGRGERTLLRAQAGPFLLVDESYNANPASMQAALATLGQAPVGPRGRRIAVIADMLELGSDGPALHAALAEPIAAHGIDLVFAAGPLMKHLWNALPPERRGVHAEVVAGIEPAVIAALRAGDAVMVKGSNGTRISRLVAALKAHFPAAAAAA